MFLPDLSRFPWGHKLVEASLQGPDAVVGEARRAKFEARPSFQDADSFGIELAKLLHLDIDPPGQVGSLVCAAQVFGGPQTIALTGAALRAEDCASWKVKRGFEILKAHRGKPSIVQLMLCGRDASSVDVLERARTEYRGYAGAPLSLLRHASTNAPAPDLERYLELGLEQAMITGTRYPVEELLEAGTSTMRHVFTRVVWGRYEGRLPSDIFVLDPDANAFIGPDFEPVAVPTDSRIGVVHPAELDPGLREPWGRFLGDLEIPVPFPQFDRACRQAGEFGFHGINVLVDRRALARFLLARGWTRRRENASDFEFLVRGALLRLEANPPEDEAEPADSFVNIESITLTQEVVREGLANDVVHTEVFNESSAVLDEFAPHVLYQ